MLVYGMKAPSPGMFSLTYADEASSLAQQVGVWTQPELQANRTGCEDYRPEAKEGLHLSARGTHLLTSELGGPSERHWVWTGAAGGGGRHVLSALPHRSCPVITSFSSGSEPKTLSCDLKGLSYRAVNVGFKDPNATVWPKKSLGLSYIWQDFFV